jgi:glycerol-3-phosphate dehydrogenase subunit B
VSQPGDSKVRVEETNVALRDFLQERWKGLLPVLWDQQLRQERLDELIYLDVLNADHLPGPQSSRLSPEMYEISEDVGSAIKGEQETAAIDQSPLPSPSSPIPDILVIGGGLAGLVTAWQAAQNGKKVRLITKGWGALHWGSGCVDVLGYLPLVNPEPLQSPASGIPQLVRDNPNHPYGYLDFDQIDSALEAFKALSTQAGYPLHGDLDRNWLLPSALGTFRPTCLAPETMIAGDLSLNSPMLVVGFEQFQDFYSELIAENIACQGRPARGVTLDIPSLSQQRFVTGRVLAASFESAEFRQELVSSLRTNLNGVARIGFPAVLGLHDALGIKRELEAQLGLPVFEIPSLPPSIPGIRLHTILVNAIERLGGRVYEGMQAESAGIEGRQINAIYTEAAARLKPHHARTFVLATGGLLGGGYKAEYTGKAREVIFDLPLSSPAHRSGWFQDQFLATQGHPIYQAGPSFTRDFRPLDGAGQPTHDNLYLAGGALGNCDPIRERSLEGLALATGYIVGNLISH